MKKISFLILGLAASLAYADGNVSIPNSGGSLKTTFGCVHDKTKNNCDNETATESVPQFKTVYFQTEQEELFNANSAKLIKGGESSLEALYERVKRDGYIVNIKVEANTDTIGSRNYNLKLSQDRANNIKKFFVDIGIDSDTITTSANGFSQAKEAKDCLKKYPTPGIGDIDKITEQAYKNPNLNAARDKALSDFNQANPELVKCMSPDRNVVITFKQAHQIRLGN